MNKYVSVMILCASIWFACTEKANGQVVVNTDGTHSVITGNIIVNPNGTHSVITGNLIVDSNGSHSVIHGNVLVAPNGSHTIFPTPKKHLANVVALRDSLGKTKVNNDHWLIRLFGSGKKPPQGTFANNSAL